MTKASLNKLRKGHEVFNTDTGEVAYFVAFLGTVGTTFYCQYKNRDGRSYYWPHHQTERV